LADRELGQRFGTDDSAGEAAVFLWRESLRYIPEKARFAAGVSGLRAGTDPVTSPAAAT